MVNTTSGKWKETSLTLPVHRLQIKYCNSTSAFKPMHFKVTY